MPLKPCKECGNQVSTIANACPHCGCNDPTGELAKKKQSEQVAGAVGCLVLFVIAMVWMARSCSGPPTPSASGPSPATSSSVPSVGDEVKLRYPGGGSSNLLVATSKKALDEFTKYSVAKDAIGVTGMLLDGRLLEVWPGTSALVLDLSWTGGLEVRLLEGEHAGRAVWIAYEFAQKE